MGPSLSINQAAGANVKTPTGSGNGGWLNAHPWAAPLLPLAGVAALAAPEIAAGATALGAFGANHPIATTAATAGAGLGTGAALTQNAISHGGGGSSWSPLPGLGGKGFNPSTVYGTNNGSNGNGTGSNTVGGTGAATPSYTPAQLTFLNSELGNIFANATGGFNSAAYLYGANALSSEGQAQSSQNNLNLQRQANAFQNTQSMLAINQALRNGLQSGAIQLAGAGAGSSSASYDMARLLGNQAAAQKESTIQNTAFQNSQLDTQQKALDANLQNSINALHQYRDYQIGQIQQNVATQLSALEQQAAQWGAPAPDESQKAQIINDGIAKLAAVDSQISQAFGAINPQNWDQAQKSAYEVMQNGGNFPNVPAPTQYSFQPNTQGLGLPQDTSGAPLTNLPLFLKQNQTQ